MVGVVGSSPIEPTNEIEVAAGGSCRGFKAVQALCAQGEYGYDIANVYRNYFGATLVEDLFRPAIWFEK